MKQIQSFLICMLLAILSVIWYGCPAPSDCNESALPTKYYYLSQDDQNKFPYNGCDTLKFLLNGIDTIVYIGSEIDTSFEYYNGVRECSGEYGYYEERKIRFQTQSPVIGSLKSFDLSLKYVPNAIEYVMLNTSGSFARKSIVSINEPYDFPSITLAGRTYMNVERVCSVGQTSACEDTSYYAYYNKQYGLLKIKYHLNMIERL